ncbi:hypothetical protein [Prochlorothrix hollandica]|uniref:Uncharacterized protein n=1 Tax=Prochlorothrix hollandica PCC 9006 = CALU 1027 TaxID=317619 RepID=A0A0M2PX65_PROHO|nr:hypothetical protein [Prochlorothrix hollandica]KKI98956.1 hypothetical protein PROH_14110 [Prochlorothrix hollandica PCC 9006 = CALU 1027]
MAYSDFKIESLVKQFSLDIQEITNYFGNTPVVEPGELLTLTLDRSLNLAVSINTEKARSELIIAPVLLEVKQRLQDQVSLFSGVDFTVESERGLNGVCDFLLSRSPEQLFVKAPVVTVVEAKNENLKSGFGQCMAEMVAAQVFNERDETGIGVIYGVVTIGTLWRFMRLEGRSIVLDRTEYFIKDLPQILGILIFMLN